MSDEKREQLETAIRKAVDEGKEDLANRLFDIYREEYTAMGRAARAGRVAQQELSYALRQAIEPSVRRLSEFVNRVLRRDRPS